MVDEQMSAAGLFVETDGIVEYHLSASDERFRRSQPTKLMIDEVRRWAKERGNRWFHLGGGFGVAADSLLHFKAGFSKIRTPFSTLRAILRPDDYRRLAHVHGEPVSSMEATDFFPVYRERHDRQSPRRATSHHHVG
jgi:hypothetical protein